MANSVYQINKGVNNSIEFHGLKAQYIWYFCIGIGCLLVFYGSMYFMGVNSLLSIGITLGSGVLMTMKIYRLSNKYGTHGLMKKMAQKRVPTAVRTFSRAVFQNLGRK